MSEHYLKLIISLLIILTAYYILTDKYKNINKSDNILTILKDNKDKHKTEQKNKDDELITNFTPVSKRKSETSTKKDIKSKKKYKNIKSNEENKLITNFTPVSKGKSEAYINEDKPVVQSTNKYEKTDDDLITDISEDKIEVQYREVDETYANKEKTVIRYLHIHTHNTTTNMQEDNITNVENSEIEIFESSTNEDTIEESIIDDSEPLYNKTTSENSDAL